MAYLSNTGAMIARKGLLARLYDAMIRMAERNNRAPQIAALEALTDAQLAQLGIRRDLIVLHVFRDKMYM